MKLEDAIAFGRRGIFAGLALAGLVIGSSATLVPQATADPHSVSVHVAPPAIPGVPDVGQPGEDAGQQTEPTIDPEGNPFWPTENNPASDPPNHSVTARGDWTAVIGVVDGARIRAQPVTGSVIGLIPYHSYYWISCKTRAPDGTVWGYATHEGRYGWVRSDLWEIVRFTAPTAPPTRPIPWC